MLNHLSYKGLLDAGWASASYQMMAGGTGGRGGEGDGSVGGSNHNVSPAQPYFKEWTIKTSRKNTDEYIPLPSYFARLLRLLFFFFLL